MKMQMTTTDNVTLGTQTRSRLSRYVNDSWGRRQQQQHHGCWLAGWPVCDDDDTIFLPDKKQTD